MCEYCEYGKSSGLGYRNKSLFETDGKHFVIDANESSIAITLGRGFYAEYRGSVEIKFYSMCGRDLRELGE